ncbi:MAG: response regulator [Bdellovibrionaceae bacterium]|nr:response regulator [Pseudobdellovibrionaceae bacterium]
MEKTKKIKLAVADDAPFIREIIKQILIKDPGLEYVGEAHNGEEAVIMAQKLCPEVILMDIVMPKKNGIQAAKEILEKQPQIKIIAFSTLDQEDMLLRALDAGCCNFLVKPFESKDVIDIIYKSFAGESR